MTDVLMLAGSLSNDLLRVASLAQRGSTQAASRFLVEAQRWSNDLAKVAPKPYIQKIAVDISLRTKDDTSIEAAETYLMYAVLLQNFCLHNQT